MDQPWNQADWVTLPTELTKFYGFCTTTSLKWEPWTSLSTGKTRRVRMSWSLPLLTALFYQELQETRFLLLQENWKSSRSPLSHSKSKTLWRPAKRSAYTKHSVLEPLLSWALFSHLCTKELPTIFLSTRRQALESWHSAYCRWWSISSTVASLDLSGNSTHE